MPEQTTSKSALFRREAIAASQEAFMGQPVWDPLQRLRLPALGAVLSLVTMAATLAVWQRPVIQSVSGFAQQPLEPQSAARGAAADQVVLLRNPQLVSVGEIYLPASSIEGLKEGQKLAVDSIEGRSLAPKERLVATILPREATTAPLNPGMVALPRGRYVVLPVNFDKPMLSGFAFTAQWCVGRRSTFEVPGVHNAAC